MTDAYRADLAYIHDAGSGHFARHAAADLLNALRAQNINTGLGVRPPAGCKAGRKKGRVWSKRMVQRMHPTAAGPEATGGIVQIWRTPACWV
jgi:hypothetical protein